jgi:hypothetical protein
MRGNIILCVHSVDMAKIVPAGLGRLRLMLTATSERKSKKEQVYSRTFEGAPMQSCALEQLFCFVGMHDTVDRITIHSVLATGLGMEIQSLEVPAPRELLRTPIVPVASCCRQVSISKFCTGEPEAATLDLPGKGPVARVHATLTFRPTECSSDAAADVERDAFGFEIVPLQRDGYRAHKDVLHKYGNDDRLRIEELLETGLFVNRQQVRSRLVSSGSTTAQSRIEMQPSMVCVARSHLTPPLTGLETRRDQGRAHGAPRRGVARLQPAQGPSAARARLIQVSAFPAPRSSPLIFIRSEIVARAADTTQSFPRCQNACALSKTPLTSHHLFLTVTRKFDSTCTARAPCAPTQPNLPLTLTNPTASCAPTQPSASARAAAYVVCCICRRPNLNPNLLYLPPLLHCPLTTPAVFAAPAALPSNNPGSYAGHPVFSTLQGQTSLGRVLLR